MYNSTPSEMYLIRNNKIRATSFDSYFQYNEQGYIVTECSQCKQVYIWGGRPEGVSCDEDLSRRFWKILVDCGWESNGIVHVCDYCVKGVVQKPPVTADSLIEIV